MQRTQSHPPGSLARQARHSLLVVRERYLPRGKFLSLIAVALLSLLGYLLGPADLAPGAYRAQVQAVVSGDTVTIDYPFVLGEGGGAEPVTLAEEQGGYRIELEGAPAYADALGAQIHYRLRVTDAAGRALSVGGENVSSTLTGPDYRQTLPPTGRDGEWLTFSMRTPLRAKVATALLFGVATLWLTELVPLAAAALLVPVVVVVAGITTPATVLNSFFHPIVVLFFAGFLLAEAMKRTGVDRLIALNILRRASLKPAFLMLTMMALTAFLSMWMSNTASVAILIPIALAVIEGIPDSLEGGERSGYRRALILGIAYAASVGGIGSAIGTPANILAMTFLNDLTATNFGFVDWFAYGLPVVVVMVPLIWLYLLLSFRVRFGAIGGAFSRDVYKRELKNLGGLGTQQKILLAVFGAIVLLWLTDRWHGIHPGIVALGGVLFLFFTNTVKEEDLGDINWNALLTFGGGLALGTVLVMTGVSDWVALQLTALEQLPALLVVFLVAGLTLLFGAFISNTAAAAMLIPLAIPLAQILQMDPRLLVAIIAIGSSIDFALVVGTPPTMMAYSTGLFNVQEIFRRGLILDLIGLLLLSFGVIWIWRLLGVVAF